MSSLYCIVLLQLTTTFALGQFVPQSKPARVAGEPAAVVRSLYRVVVTRHPIGLPWAADRKALAPYLRQGGIRELNTALACAGDYSRQHPKHDEKPEFAWFEQGLFSGGNERALPGAFHVENTQPDKDGSFRVHVRLKYTEPPAAYWYVDVIVKQEDGHFVVDDVVYLKDQDRDVESRLSHELTAGCDGSRWVGYGEEQNDSK